MPVYRTPTDDGHADSAVAQPPEDLLAQVQADTDRLRPRACGRVADVATLHLDLAAAERGYQTDS
jgi:hypothetical protein